MASPVPPDLLNDKQRARRKRVTDAAIALAATGGYDAMQMRDVSEHADVALGTIYRYFSSKDHLLVSAMAEWTGELEARLDRSPPRGDTPADQLVDVLRRACRNLERQPLLAAALVKAMASSDEGVAEAAQTVQGQIRGFSEPILQHLDDDVREDIILVIRSVWHSTLLNWVNGRHDDLSAVGEQLERAVRLVVPAGPATVDPSPDGADGRSG
ncbi:TetR family transcriptional regulator [Acidimicrobiia bacterium EGI L10123]|uniref:TetR family transcriptional regulator n=1 Tax=Salinilacustrithrix flava TaxID=2957203 RepID=UPI003D7C2E18|nr:TetR family transcriptional regulator [Acidimicrobiia bacterium EGI L10123]